MNPRVPAVNCRQTGQVRARIVSLYCRSQVFHLRTHNSIMRVISRVRNTVSWWLGYENYLHCVRNGHVTLILRVIAGVLCYERETLDLKHTSEVKIIFKIGRAVSMDHAAPEKPIQFAIKRTRFNVFFLYFLRDVCRSPKHSLTYLMAVSLPLPPLPYTANIYLVL